MWIREAGFSHCAELLRYSWEAQPAGLLLGVCALLPKCPRLQAPALPALSLAAKRRKVRALLGSSLFLMVLCDPSTVSHVPAMLSVHVCKRDGNDHRCNSRESSGELAYYWGMLSRMRALEGLGTLRTAWRPPEKNLAGAVGGPVVSRPALWPWLGEKAEARAGAQQACCGARQTRT